MDEQNFKAFFEFSTDLLSITSFDGYFVKLNDQWSKILGFTTEELTGAPFLDFVHPDDYERTAKEAEALFTNQPGTINFENRYRTKSGKYIWLEWNSVIDPEKKILYSVARDLTSFKEREEKDRLFSDIVLRLSALSSLESCDINGFINGFLTATIDFFDVDSVSYWKLSADRGRIVCTHSDERNGAIPRVGNELLEKDSPLYFKGILSKKIVAADDAKTHPNTLEFNRGYLEDFNVASMLDAQVSGESDFWGIVCLESAIPRAWSIVEQNRLLSLTSVLSVGLLNHEREKSSLELSRLSNILNSVSEGVVITNTAKEVTWLNRGFEKMTGYSLPDLMGMDMGIILQGPETDPEHIEAIKSGISSGLPFTQEILNYAKGGNKIWMELSISPFKNKDGFLKGYYGFLKDITRRKAAEAEQEKLNSYFQVHHRITTEHGLSRDDFLEAYVELGIKLFGLEVGIIGKKEGEHCEILKLAARTPTTIKAGEKFPLKGTICCSLIEKGKAIAVNDIPNNAYQDPPIFESGGLKSFIGAPIYLNEEVFGTIYFSSENVRTSDFSQKEIALLELMAGDLTKQLEFDLTQEQLRVSEERYRSVVDALSEGIVVQDVNAAITMCNEAAAHILGLTIDQLVGKDSYDPLWKALDPNGDPIPPEDHPAMVTSNTGQPVRGFLMDVWKTDGKRSIISINTEPVVNQQGEMYAVVASFSDVTEEVQAKRNLEQSIKRIGNIADGVPGALLQYKLNKDGTDELLYISDQAKDVWGVSPEEAMKNVGLIWSKIIAEDIPDMQLSIMKSAEELSFWNYIYRIKDESGKVKWLNTRGMPRKGPDGSVIWDTLALDVTTLKETEISLHKALDEKNLLFRELHHRIKNNLNMVNNLLYLRGRFTNNQELLDFIKDTQNRILSIAKTYELLLKLEEFDRLYTKEYLEYLLSSLVGMYAQNPEQYEMKINIENHKLHVDKLAALGLLVFEVVTNVFKYAYDEHEKGEVLVSLMKVDDQLNLSIADKGRGLKDERNFIEGASLGMSLIKAFVFQLKGELQINGDGGVSYAVSFPMN